MNSETMHLIFPDPYAIPGPTPSAIQSLQNADALARSGARVTVITPEPPSGFNAEHVLGRQVHPNLSFIHLPDIRRRWFFPFRSNRMFFRRAAQIVKGIGGDALFVRNLKLAGYLLARNSIPPLYFETHEIFAQSFTESHDLDSWVARRKLRKLAELEASVYRSSRGLICITATLRDDIQLRFPDAAQCHVAPDGVDVRLAATATTSNRRDDTPVFLYLGSLHPWKGVPVLIEAMQYVPRGKLRIAGGTTQRIGELKQLCERLGVTDKVELMGSVPPKTRFDLIADADVCLLPSSASSIGSRYTSPLKLFEYLAMSKAVIAADLPALREVLTDGDNAILVPVGNSEGMAAAMNRLVNEPALTERLASAAGQLAERYTWDSRAAGLLCWIKQLMENKR